MYISRVRTSGRAISQSKHTFPESGHDYVFEDFECAEGEIFGNDEGAQLLLVFGVDANDFVVGFGVLADDPNDQRVAHLEFRAVNAFQGFRRDNFGHFVFDLDQFQLFLIDQHILRS